MADNTPISLLASDARPLSDTPAHASYVIPAFPGTFVSGTSTGGAQANSPTLPAVSAKTNYVAGFTITASGATGAAQIAVTLADGTTTLNYTLVVPAGATVAVPTLSERFNPPLPASTVNTAWVLTCASLGTGNLACSSNIWGYLK